MSAELQWECVRKFNCFQVKRNGVTFSTERGNLKNINSFKYSGLVHPRSVRVESAGAKGGVVISRRRTQAGNKVATAFTIPARIKSTCVAASTRKVAADLERSYYRLDLIGAAKARAAAILKSQRPRKVSAKKN